MKKLEGTDYAFSESLSQTNLWQFKQVAETGDVRYLLLLNDYTCLPECDTTDLDSAWFDIYSGFSDIAGGGQSELWLTKQKRVMAMEFEYNQGARILNMVDKLRIPEMVDGANKFGFAIDLKDYDKTFAKARAKLVRLKNTIKSERKLNESNEEEKTDFDALITTLEKHQGYQFSEKEMTVKKFANIYKQFKAWQTEK